ncbi:MAG: 50S ribosomal protein L6 [Candidatus Hydrogenedentes bacterium]|nr:50S ribosomal protein L6 [Candidatus Hydrogenedentota bacterium]
MSRVGNLPVPVPSSVKCVLKGSTLVVTGPKGTLEETFQPQLGIEVTESEVIVSRSSDSGQERAFHGLTRALINNMVVGVTEGYERTLLIEGVGYRASLKGKVLNLLLGYSHPITVEPPEGVTFTVDGQQTIKISGISKQLVGQIAANVRAFRKPEPYKGKGIRYQGEHIRRKAGKAGGK